MVWLVYVQKGELNSIIYFSLILIWLVNFVMFQISMEIHSYPRDVFILEQGLCEGVFIWLVNRNNHLIIYSKWHVLHVEFDLCVNKHYIWITCCRF